jgi:hypothetical protein
MDRRTRRRLREIERQIPDEKRRLEQEWQQMEEYFRPRARLHAVAVAAIVLEGEPKVDEPLQLAWERAAERYGIAKDVVSAGDYTKVARKLLPKIIKPETDDPESGLLVFYMGSGLIRTKAEIAAPTPEESNKFSEIFRNAPIWLAMFTSLMFDALYLKFDFPKGFCSIGWGRDGREEAKRWPELPLGTMTAGEPVEHSPFDCLSTDDLMFLMSLREKSENDWSLTERRRRELIFKQVSRRAKQLDRG